MPIFCNQRICFIFNITERSLYHPSHYEVIILIIPHTPFFFSIRPIFYLICSLPNVDITNYKISSWKIHTQLLLVFFYHSFWSPEIFLNWFKCAFNYCWSNDKNKDVKIFSFSPELYSGILVLKSNNLIKILYNNSTGLVIYENVIILIFIFRLVT